MQSPVHHPETILAQDATDRLGLLVSLGRRFREERERLGLGRQRVAEAAGYSAEQVRRVEAGDKQPGVLLVRALGVLGADVGYVLLGIRAEQRDPRGTAMHPADIAAALKRSGYSQKDVGDLCGVGRGVANAVIRGVGRSSKVEQKVAELTGLPLHALWPDWYPPSNTERAASVPIDERIDRLEASFARIESQLLLLQQLIQQHTTDRSNPHA